MKRVLSILMVLCLVLSMSVSASAAGEKQHDYSASANSGIRHEVCTSLLGTSADSYYTGSYTYENLSALTSSSLLSTLRTLMKSTHTKNSTYADCHYKANLTDCENGDGTSISLIYTSYSATQADWCNSRSSGWNREHVWPKALGGFDETGAGADLHHIRPSDQPINSARANKKYGNVDGGSDAKGAAYTGNAIGGTYNSTYFEPLDNVKGDVARICLYVYVRYGGELSKCSSITNVFQSVDVLLQWCQLDPVDTWEMGRNEVVGAIQGNRNVFIDYPELAWLLFDKEIPSSMTTPSGNAAGNSGTTTQPSTPTEPTVPSEPSAPTQPTGCVHSHTIMRNQKSATCTQDGYTGDTYCTDCGEKIATGTATPQLSHTNGNKDNKCDVCGGAVTCEHGQTQLANSKSASCSEDGYTGDECCIYCGEVIVAGQVIPASGEHSFGEWVSNEDLSSRTCTVCGYQEVEYHPEPTETEPAPTESATEPATEPVTEPATEPVTAPTEPSAQEPTTQPTAGSSATDPTEPAPAPDFPVVPVVIVIVILAMGAVVILVLKKKKS